MGILDELRTLSSAEEIFHLLDVPYDPKLLAVARLHVLRRLGDALAQLTPAATDRAERAQVRALLESAYRDLVARPPLQQRLFKVHRRALVPLTGLGSKH